MTIDLSLEEQVEIVRGTLSQTQSGKIDWEETGDLGVYRSVRSSAVALLDRVGAGVQARVRLRFSPPGETDFDTIILQSLPVGEAFRAEQDLDSLLEYLYSRVDRQSRRYRNSATKFLADED